MIISEFHARKINESFSMLGIRQAEFEMRVEDTTEIFFYLSLSHDEFRIGVKGNEPVNYTTDDGSGD